MCDKIIHIVKSNGIQDTREQNRRIRKGSFQRRFIDVLFSADEENQVSENKAAGERISKMDEASLSSRARTGDHEVMLREVSALPKERRRSLLSSIIDRLIGLEVNESTNENLSNHSEETDSTEITSGGFVDEKLNVNNESNGNINFLTSKKKENAIGNGQHSSTAKEGAETKSTVTNDEDKNETQKRSFDAGSYVGIANKGLEGSEIESIARSPDQITGKNVNQIHTNHAASITPEMDRSTTSAILMKNKPFVSPDPECALPATTRPKTIRAWLKDPRLYKVIHC